MLNLSEQLTILKLGGSVITKKRQTLTPNLKVIKRLAKEIYKAQTQPTILVHGGGSYGHPLAKEHQIANGFKNSSQLFGFSRTHEAMTSLNKIVVREMLEQKLPAFGVAPSSFIITKNGRIHLFMKSVLEKAVKLGLIPILYGDTVLDLEKGFSILSGDQIAAWLSIELKAKKLIMGVDVNGLFDSDPKTNPNAKLIRTISTKALAKFRSNLKNDSSDTTGKMSGKISELIKPAEEGIMVMIINAHKVNNIFKALVGEEVNGTKIRK